MAKLRKYVLVIVILAYNNNTPGKAAEDVPLSTPLECARLCQENEPPKTCYYHWTLEQYMTLGKACTLCTPNSTNTFTATCQCILADGVEKSILTANRMLPGPSIQVCLGDKVIVDVDNRIDGAEVTIHWHGVFQQGSQYYDGVPFITQCPIHKGNIFRYQWIAGNSGTHFYHAHTGLQKLDGLTGSLIIRKPASKDPSSTQYDQELIEHVILLQDWMFLLAGERFPGRVSFELGETPNDLLINGKGRTVSPWTGCLTKTKREVFTVQPGKRYRFRLINAFATVCPAQFAVEGHRLTLIATDGVPVKPVVVDTIISVSGERYDFVINATQSPRSYWIQVRALGECGNKRLQQLAILKYEGAAQVPSNPEPSYDKGLRQGVVLNPLSGNCTGDPTDSYCINQLVNAERVDSGICEKSSVEFNLPTTMIELSLQELFQQGQYKTFLATPIGSTIISLINDYEFSYPPSPLTSQLNDVDSELFCNSTKKPESCNGTYCSCIHMIDIPANNTVQLVLWDQVEGLTNITHPFHIHGYAFNVVAMGRSPNGNIEEYVMEKVRELDTQEYQERCKKAPPPSKDTIALPQNGFVVLRFVANNPGFWFFHCHFLYHIANGMNMVVHVQGELPPVPPNFPKCGHFKSKIDSNLMKTEL